MDVSKLSNTINIYTPQNIATNLILQTSIATQTVRPIKEESSLETSAEESNEFSHNIYIARQAYLRQESKANESSKTEFNNNNAQKIESKTKTQDSNDEFTEAEQKNIEALKAEDIDTKDHERAHQSAGGQYAGSPSYDYERGPDGKNYAIGGHVNIDVSEESTPEKTLQKMQKVIQAAKAPSDPSSQDLKVAAEASQKIAQARQEIAQQNVNTKNNSKSNTPNGDKEA